MNVPFPADRSQAVAWDAEDALAAFRDEFHFPQHEGQPVVYLTGNSLGLQPKGAAAALRTELDDWARLGVEGHFHATNPWKPYHERFTEASARLVGALPGETVMMNQLTANLHFLLVSFYRPKGKRRKILTEARPFPSDTYAFASQVAFHGGDPAVDLVEVQPRPGEQVLRTEDILATIERLGDELALVCFGAVNFYTGQLFDIPAITKAAHAVGAIAGFDLAHAAGNVPLNLHDDGVDFAAWCTYKYLNSGPGSVGGVFVHNKHKPAELPLFAGWWGHDKATRFQMGSVFQPMRSAEAWQVSNAPVFNMAIHAVALELHDRAGMQALRAKSLRLTAYLEHVIKDVAQAQGVHLEIITPSDPAQRGCQLSVVAHGMGRGLFDALTQAGIVLDWREPNVIRMAPVPLYNSFTDVYHFGQALNTALQALKA